MNDNYERNALHWPMCVWMRSQMHKHNSAKSSYGSRDGHHNYHRRCIICMPRWPHSIGLKKATTYTDEVLHADHNRWANIIWCECVASWNQDFCFCDSRWICLWSIDSMVMYLRMANENLITIYRTTTKTITNSAKWKHAPSHGCET